MCGRFVSASPPDEIADYFDAYLPQGVLEPNYNVAPTDDVYAVLVHGGARRLDAFHWGLVPGGARDPKVGARMINARAETLAAKGAYAAAFRHRRCLVPADGFYEWRTHPGTGRKQPYYIRRSDGQPLAFAGLWALWRGPRRQGEPVAPAASGDGLRSCTIVTTAPNETVAKLHDRMPVILPPSRWDEWLDPANDDLAGLARLLVPAPARLVVMHPVSSLVSSVRNNGPELIVPVPLDDEPDAGGRLFAC